MRCPYSVVFSSNYHKPTTVKPPTYNSQIRLPLVLNVIRGWSTIFKHPGCSKKIHWGEEWLHGLIARIKCTVYQTKRPMKHVYIVICTFLSPVNIKEKGGSDSWNIFAPSTTIQALCLALWLLPITATTATPESPVKSGCRVHPNRNTPGCI